MINAVFYSSRNRVNVFSDDVAHFPRREYHKVFETTDYIVKSGEDLYDIARHWFGKDLEYHWTIIADLNNVRKPEDIVVGETIQLPNVILSETENKLPYYGKYSAVSTSI